jgi:NADH-quinone oxidoreductase subunit A
VSVTATATGSATGSGSATATGSGSATATATATVSATAAVSATVAVAVSATASVAVAVAVSASATASVAVAGRTCASLSAAVPPRPSRLAALGRLPYPRRLEETPHTVHVLADVDLSGYLPIGILLLMAILFGAVNLVATHLLGPRARGETKDIVYESGMNPFGTARKRFNVRFYILAMTFLVFDVEIIFLYPWAVTFAKLTPRSPEATLFLGRIMFFIGTSIVAYLYAWRKGVFRWD